MGFPLQADFVEASLILLLPCWKNLGVVVYLLFLGTIGNLWGTAYFMQSSFRPILSYTSCLFSLFRTVLSTGNGLIYKESMMFN